MSNNQTPWCATSGRRTVSCAASLVAALATSTLTLFSANALAMKTDFNIDYRATGFYAESDSFDTNDESNAGSDTGFAQYLRLGADFKHEETGVEVHTRLELAGDRWSGDNRDYTTTADRAFNPSNRGDNVRLDIGFVQVPLGKTLLRVGRQESNWNNCFLVCDDRRDRIFVARSFGKVSAFIGYDRRNDDTSFASIDNGDQFFPGFVTPIFDTGFTGGFLFLYYLDNYQGSIADYPLLAQGSQPYVLDNAKAISPYVTGKIGPFQIETGFNYFDGSHVSSPTPEDGDYFTDAGWSEYFRIGTEFDRYEARFQYVGAQDGGLISSGFDTYSSLINSNPESTANPTSVYNMGGFLGRKGFDQSLYIANLTADITPKLTFGGSVGLLDIDVGDSLGGGSDSSMVYDVELSYQYNAVFRTWATLGLLEKNDVGALTGNSLLGATPNGGAFAEDDVMAGSVNIGVKF
ncbi:hypothetical protein [Salinisphaera sp. T31B1]|uniref:hypothetical protein n=1 Tax=Salinisphaera sp. T31B1 TaxID=727963 RepID=UPI00333F6ECF